MNNKHLVAIENAKSGDKQYALLDRSAEIIAREKTGSQSLPDARSPAPWSGRIPLQLMSIISSRPRGPDYAAANRGVIAAPFPQRLEGINPASTSKPLSRTLNPTCHSPKAARSRSLAGRWGREAIRWSCGYRVGHNQEWPWESRERSSSWHQAPHCRCTVQG